MDTAGIITVLSIVIYALFALAIASGCNKSNNGWNYDKYDDGPPLGLLIFMAAVFWPISIFIWWFISE